jgi:hypothetical protein
MTQGSSGGQTATGDASPGSAPAGGAPSPTNPTNSTPWGSTSTSNQGSGLGGGPAWSSAPLGAAYADAPTASVPLVSDGPATSAPTTSTPSSTGRAGGGHSAAARARGPRRARLQLRHINPWTVLKFSCVLSIALFFVWLIVIGVLFGVLDGAGVINKINDAYTTIQGGNAKAPVTAGVVFGGAAIIGVVNIVLFIALSTVGSVVYNLCADLVGGVEITLSER